MKQQMVLCPNKDCRHEFPTRKEEAQCWKCKERFISLEHILDSKKIVIKEPHENKIKKIQNLLETLSSKHEETGIAIKKIHQITKKSRRGIK